METIIGSSSTTNRYYIWGLDHLGLIQSSARYYYLKDHLGSIRMTINKNGKVVSYNDYYPYGSIMPMRSMNMAMADERYKFCGNERDAETGYDHNGDRSYDSFSGRLLSRDPFAEKDPSRSPYSYAGNNPCVFIDMNGDSIYVSGSQSQTFMNLLGQRTGLIFSQLGTGALVIGEGPVQSDLISPELADLVESLIGSSNIINVNAINASDNVFFDADARLAKPGFENAVDMGDFSAISNVPELQAALLGHIMMERATSGDFYAAHDKALQFETQIMKKLTGEPVSLRTCPFSDPSSSSYHQGRGPLNGRLYFNDLDYGTRYYYLVSPYSTPFNSNIILGAVRAKR